MLLRFTRLVSGLGIPLLLLLITGCQGDLAMETPGLSGIWGISLPKSTFADQAPIPAKYAAGAGNVSPPLEWRPLVDQIVEYVVIMEDKDAKSGPTMNWAVYGIPASTTSLPEGASTTTKFPQGRNFAGAIGYMGPGPGDQHHYHFQVFGLFQPLDLAPGADRATLLAAMKGKVVAVSDLRGVYPIKP